LKIQGKNKNKNKIKNYQQQDKLAFTIKQCWIILVIDFTENLEVL